MSQKTPYEIALERIQQIIVSRTKKLFLIDVGLNSLPEKIKELIDLGVFHLS